MSRHTPRDRRYLALTQQVKREEPDCWLCGHPIDPTLRAPDPWSFSLDHVVPCVARPDLAHDRGNARAAHRRCNGRRGTAGLALVTSTHDDPGPSRAW